MVTRTKGSLSELKKQLESVYPIKANIIGAGSAKNMLGALTGFWLALKSLKAVTAGLEAGADYMEEVKKRGRLGALDSGVWSEAEGAPEQVLTTFMVHVAERQETVIECFGACRVKEAYSAEEGPATQRKAKVMMTFNALGVIKERGRGRNAGRRARGKGELARALWKQLRDLQNAQQK